MEYLIFYSVSSICAGISVSTKRRLYPISIFFSTLSVFALSVLNWTRDYSIGTDINVYGNSIFYSAVASSSFTQFFAECRRMNMYEIGYALLNYIVASFTSNHHIFYLIIGLITNAIFYYCLQKETEGYVFFIAWIGYLTLIFPTTLNLLRQSFAFALILLSCIECFNKKYRFSIALLIFAFLFHQSAIIGILIIVYIILLQRSSTRTREYRLSYVFILFSLFLSVIIRMLNNYGLFSSKYSQYVALTNNGESLSSSIVVRLPFIILAVFSLMKFREQLSIKQIFLYTIVIAESCLLPLKLVSSTTFRIALYLGIFKPISYVDLLNKISKSRITLYLFYALYSIYLVMYFYLQIVIGGANEIYPFKFAYDLF